MQDQIVFVGLPEGEKNAGKNNRPGYIDQNREVVDIVPDTSAVPIQNFGNMAPVEIVFVGGQCRPLIKNIYLPRNKNNTAYKQGNTERYNGNPCDFFGF